MARRARKLTTTRGAAAKRRARRQVAAVAPKANPPVLADLKDFVLPGFAGYAGTRLVSRIAYAQLSKRWPGLAPHLAVGSSLASVAAAWFLVHRWQKIAKYHTPVVVGSSIAALQTIVQTYLPKFGWIVSDYQPTVGSATMAPKLAATAAARLPRPAPAAGDDDDDLDLLSDDLGTLAVPTLDNVAAGLAAEEELGQASDDGDTDDLGLN